MACKTGTSFGRRDAWAVAFDARAVVAVWLGDPRGRPHRDLVGLGSAAPVALAILREVAEGEAPAWPRPGDVARRQACARSGYPAGPFCERVAREWFLSRAPALPRCPVDRRVRVDLARGIEVCAACARATGVWRTAERWPAPVAAWMRLQGREVRDWPHAPDCPRSGRGGEGPRILSPAPGSRYVALDPAVWPGGGPQEVRFAAAAGAGARELYWFVDGEFLEAAPPGRDVFWRLVPGGHEVVCADGRGRASAVRFEVEAGGRLMAAGAGGPRRFPPR